MCLSGQFRGWTIFMASVEGMKGSVTVLHEHNKSRCTSCLMELVNLVTTQGSQIHPLMFAKTALTIYGKRIVLLKGRNT